MLVELMTAGLQPELVARVANACAAAYARGLIDGTPQQRTNNAERQARFRRRNESNAEPLPSVTERYDALRSNASLSPAPSISKENKDSSFRQRSGMSRG